MGSSGGFLGSKPFRNSDPSMLHPPFSRPQKAGCHGCCPEVPGDPVAQSQAWVSGGRACHHEAQNNLLPVASLPFQRPNWSSKGPSPGTLKGPEPVSSKRLSVFEYFLQQWFSPEVYLEDSAPRSAYNLPCDPGFPVYILRRLGSSPTLSLALV